MPTYKNVAPRIVGVNVSRQLVLVEPGRTVECSADEAEPQVKKGALALLPGHSSDQHSGHSSDSAPAAPKAETPKPAVSASGRSARPRPVEPKE